MGTKKLNITDIVKKQLPPRDFVFLGLKKGSVGFLNSPGGTGKSMLALHLAFSIADESQKYNFEPFVNQNTNRGKVTYLSLEDPTDILEERIQNLSKLKEINSETISSVNKNLAIYPLYGKGFTLAEFSSEKTIQIRQIEYETLFRLGIKSRLIIIDTFRRVHDTDENNNGQMSKILKVFEDICDKTGTSFLLLHHQNKGGLNDKVEQNQGSMRGASALADNARLVINLSFLSEDEIKKYSIQEDRKKEFVKVIYSKVNYARIPQDFALAKGFNGTLSKCNCEEEKKKNIKEKKNAKKF